MLPISLISNMDLKEQCSISESQRSGISNGNNISYSDGNNKKCNDCQTSTTPLWRGGPAGPKTLCNACGIKYHKKRRALLGIQKGKAEKLKKSNNNNNNNNNIIKSTNNNIIKSTNNNIIGMPLKIKVIRQIDRLGEVEQAALLLMAMSYGSVYA